MNLEHELNRSWSLFQSGVPVYKEGGMLAVDEISPAPGLMTQEAMALGDAATPKALDSTGRAVGGGLRDTAQQVLNVGGELVDGAAKLITGQPIGALDAVKNIMPKVETQGLGEDLGRLAVNVISNMLLTRGAGIKNPLAVGGMVDALLDPEEGNLSTLLNELGVTNDVVTFLNSKVDEDAGATERLQARLKNAVEGAGIGYLFDGLMLGIKGLKENPKAAAAVATVLGGTLLPEDAEGGVIDRLLRATQKADNSIINKSFTGKGAKTLREGAAAEVARIRELYPESEGWAPLELNGVTWDKKKKVYEVKWKQPAYNFHVPPEGVGKQEWAQTLSDRVVSDVQSVVDRAAQGDEQAKYILSQATWYRDMRNRLRGEFGGMADLFADLLGTTSAQTNVRTNWDNASEILRRFSRGEYDKEIANYTRAMAAGEDPNKVFKGIRSGYENSSSLETRAVMTEDEALAAALQDYPMLTKAAGTLFGTNSPTSTGALIDTFRQIKAGASPKTPNFTGNLIGYTNEATIDVWAARYLSDLAGNPRIPPPSEKAVGGKHLVGSTIDAPRVGGEFGFGQDVFRSAAEKINENNIIPGEKLGPDDLQAVAWFIEKEKWTKQGWTNKAGEGGSLDFEANRAGTSDPQRIAELRTVINSVNSTPEQIAAAQKEFDQLAAPVDRTVLGVSGERPDRPMSNYAQAELAAEFDDVLRGDSTVIAYKATNTYGRFMKQDERALDVEIVTRKGFDPTELERRVVQMGKQYDQDAVFVSRVLRSPDAPNARPGVEIYFAKKQSADAIRELTDVLTEKGIDGFTFVTDARQADRVNVQARSGGADTAGLVGVRFQYIPEFDDAFDAAKRDQIMMEKAEIFRDVVEEIASRGGVSSAQVVWYDTKVTFRDQYDGILNAGRTPPQLGGEVREGQLYGANAARSDRQGSAGAVGSGAVPNGVSGSAQGTGKAK